MGCCCSKEEDRFDDRSALLSKSRTDQNDAAKAKQQAANGHYAKPVATAPPSVVKPSVSNQASNGSTRDDAKKSKEEVHPTVNSVDLLGLDQPPSPPPAHAKPQIPVVSPPKPKPASPPRTASNPSAPSGDDDEFKSLRVLTTQPSNEVLSDLMPPRPSPPPQAVKKAPQAPAPAPPAEAPFPSSASAAPTPTPTPTPTVEASVDAEDNDDNDDNDGDNDDNAATTGSNGTNGSTSSKSTKKKKKKKGKK